MNLFHGKFLFFFGVTVFFHIAAAAVPSEVSKGDLTDELLTVSNSSREARRSVVSTGLFGIVSFDNVACNGTSGEIGTCYSARECTNMGGTLNGRCAGNYGVCCAFDYTCGGIITANNSHFNNPGYPGTTGGPLVCSVSLKQLKGATSFELIFETFKIRNPSNGPCTNDTFNVTVSGSTTTYPILCGVNDGGQEYIPWAGAKGLFKRSVDESAPRLFSKGSGSSLINIPGLTGLGTATLTFTLATGSDERSWRIRIVQYKGVGGCSAPAGCLQYYNDINGFVQSYNYNGGTGELIALNQCYNQCFFVPSGYCSVTLTEVTFMLPGTAPNTCTTDYLLVNGQRFCGDTLGTNGTLTVTPTTGMNYVSITHCSGSTNPDMDLGYRLSYMLQPC